MSAARVLAIEAAYDAFTEGGSRCRQLCLFPYLRERGCTVRLLAGTAASREHLLAQVAEGPVDLLTGVGHGAVDRYKGHEGRNVLRVGRHERAFWKGAIVHLAACHTAFELGQDLVAHGCAAFFGYAGTFHYPADHAIGWERDLFFTCDAEIDRALADGCTAEVAFRRAYDAYSQGIEALVARGARDLALLLQQNRGRLRGPSAGRGWGDPEARLRAAA